MTRHVDLSWIEEEAARKDKFPWQVGAIVARNRRIALYLLRVDSFDQGDARLLKHWEKLGYAEFRRNSLGRGEWRRTEAGDIYLGLTEEQAAEAQLCGCCLRPVYHILDRGEIVDAACVWPECPDRNVKMVEEIHHDFFERFNGMMSVAFRARGRAV